MIETSVRRLPIGTQNTSFTNVNPICKLCHTNKTFKHLFRLQYSLISNIVALIVITVTKHILVLLENVDR
jgi:hypothetical protein